MELESTDEESHRPSSDTPSTEKNYFVFQSCLERLLHYCPVCHQHVTETVLETTGTLLTVQYTCAADHHNRWHSQPLLRGMAAGNSLLSATFLFSGSTFTKFARLADILNLSSWLNVHSMMYMDTTPRTNIPASSRPGADDTWRWSL